MVLINFVWSIFLLSSSFLNFLRFFDQLPFNKRSSELTSPIKHDLLPRSFLFTALPSNTHLFTVHFARFIRTILFSGCILSTFKFCTSCLLAMTRLTRVRPRKDLSSRPRGQRSWPGLLSEYCLQVSDEFDRYNRFERLANFRSKLVA